MLATLIKQPAETLRPGVAFATDVPIAAIVAVTVRARGLVPGAPPLGAAATIAAGRVVASLSSGGDGERYAVTILARDADGAELESELEIVVIDTVWQPLDGGTAYLSIAEFVKGFGLDEVVRMTDPDGSGRIDRDLLVKALSDAQAIADAHLVGRYATPLATVPPIVALAIADLARNRLYPRGAPEGVGDAAKAAMRLLERIQSGAMPLAAAGAAAAEAPSATPVLIAPGRRQYPRGLEDY